MSTPRLPSAAPSQLNLDQQRKRAKELLRAHRRGDSNALARVEQQLSKTSDLKLADAQHVVAREAGFDGWARLKLHVTQTMLSRTELVRALLSATLEGRDDAVESVLAIAPDLAHQSLHVAAALADEQAVRAQLASKPPALGPEGAGRGSPLAQLCHARFGRERDTVRAARARIARMLIAAGADPNECVDAPDTPGGQLSVLSAAARHTKSVELVDELLAAGAVLEPPGSTAGPPAPPLVGAALGGSLSCVQRLLVAGAPKWQAREALEVAIEHGDRAMARVLLDYGCLPDQAGRWRGRNGGCLHAALALGLDTSFLALLLDGGASLDARDRDGRSPWRVAAQLNALDALDLFRRSAHERADTAIDEVDYLLQACFACDRTRVEALLRTEPQLIARCSPSDHQNVCLAVRRGETGALAELLHAGFDPNALDDDGQTALHLAVLRRDVEAVGILIAHGASPRAPNYDNLSAWELACRDGDAALCSSFAGRFQNSEGTVAASPPRDDVESSLEPDLDEISELIEARRIQLENVFEEALGCMSAGDVEGLRRCLDREPRLATARSQRYHRATLLHYLGNNGTERNVAPENLVAVAELLIERGAIVDASCHMYGGGPNQTTLGLAVTSDHSVYVRGALTGLIDVLVRAGARVHEADGRSRALEGAIMYGAVTALRALAQNGARAYDLPTAAALGDLSLLDALLAEAPGAARVAAFENAATFEQLGALERLFEAGVELDALGDYGATALHKAAAAHSVLAVRWLLDHGADPLARDRVHQGTPADWARHFGSHETFALLEAAQHPKPD